MGDVLKAIVNLDRYPPGLDPVTQGEAEMLLPRHPGCRWMLQRPILQGHGLLFLKAIKVPTGEVDHG